jgi:hypothetical protein
MGERWEGDDRGEREVYREGESEEGGGRDEWREKVRGRWRRREQGGRESLNMCMHVTIEDT